MKQLIALTLLVYSSFIAAEEGILINPLPQHQIEIIEKALIGRGWEIQAIDDSEIQATASNVGRAVTANLTIFYADGGFNYIGDAVKKVLKPGFSGNSPKVKRIPTEIPQKWLFLLRTDITSFKRAEDS